MHLRPSSLFYYHLSSSLCSLKWFPTETSKFWYFAPRTFSDIPMYDNSTTLTTSYLPDWVDASWLWIVAVPLLWFTVHTVRTLREYHRPHTNRMLTTIGCEGKVQSPLWKGGCIFYFQFYTESSWIKRDFITKIFLVFILSIC